MTEQTQVTSTAITTLRLKKGCAKPLHGGHPWVFADAVAGLDGATPAPGDEVRVLDERGACLGRGFYSPRSAIPVRLLSRSDTPITTKFLEERIDEAIALRKDVLRLGATGTTAYRLINSEGDGLGGLTVDVYGDYISVQIGTAGMFKRSDILLDALEARLHPKGIFDRSEVRPRQIEQIPPPQTGPLRGTEPTDSFLIQENGISLQCDLRAGHGQKTGLYLDQRDNRARMASFAAGRDVLDVFCYTGAFSLYAAKAGAKSLTLLESSTEALTQAKENLALNKVEDAELINAEWTDGFSHLRESNRQFDLIVLDPPKFSRSREQVLGALSGYRDLNAQAARLLKPGGLLFTCSCSGTVSIQEFERAVANGLRGVGRRAELLERRGAACDHPVPPGFDQGSYLKCLVMRVM